MKILKENIYELILLIGILFISIGFFMLSVPVGFIVLGLSIILCVLALWWLQKEGGDK